VKESVGVCEVGVERKNGADGIVSIAYKTKNINALDKRDYEASCGVLEFAHGEISKTIPINIIDGISSIIIKIKNDF
jgi:solute carrier family 8 (sodium/calcium exchanger)